jgi:uncharacterized protein YjbI with pentapeptide repeats
LSDAKLNGASFAGANLTEGNLRNAELNRANLVTANLQSATLRNANVREANLLGACLDECSVRGADMRGALYATKRQFSAVIADQDTKFPEFQSVVGPGT